MLNFQIVLVSLMAAGFRFAFPPHTYISVRPKLILYVNVHAYRKIETSLGNCHCVSFPHL